MSKSFFIIHGAYGSSEENWSPWFREELTKEGFQVFTPNFPTPQGQTLENWLKVFREYEYYLDEEAFLAGHSVGAAFVLSVLENLQKPVRACFLVAGFVDFLDNSAFDDINESFVDKDFDWEKIRKNCENFYIYHADNDPFVPLVKAEYLAERLDVELKVIKDAGHFNRAAGYDKFELLLEDIRKTSF